ncbi:hypothetical protein CTA2_7106 [Colletotrichum tanaceti]|nr:hypothetical protein CTA2_7106 [Colletotrichum tanaceti]
MPILLTVAKATTVRRQVSSGCTLLFRRPTRCHRLHRSGAPSEVRPSAGGHALFHATSRSPASTGSEIVTGAAKKGPQALPQEPGAEKWGSAAPERLPPRPAVAPTVAPAVAPAATGALRASSESSASKTQTAAAKEAAQPAPKGSGSAEWGSFHNQSATSHPEEVERKPRRAAIRTPKNLPAPRWRPDSLLAKASADSWGLFHALPEPASSGGHPAPVADSSVVRAAEIDEPADSGGPPEKRYGRSKEAMERRLEKRKEKMKEKKRKKKEEMRSPNLSRKPVVQEEIERFYRPRISWPIGDAYWMELLLGNIDTPGGLPGDCSTCLRHSDRRTFHHVVPKGVAHLYPSDMKDEVIAICHPCHKVLHGLFSHRKLADDFTWSGPIVRNSLFKMWLAFAERFSLDELHHLMAAPAPPSRNSIKK